MLFGVISFKKLSVHVIDLNEIRQPAFGSEWPRFNRSEACDSSANQKLSGTGFNASFTFIERIDFGAEGQLHCESSALLISPA